jgi:hypothetical protein
MRITNNEISNNETEESALNCICFVIRDFVIRYSSLSVRLLKADHEMVPASVPPDELDTT